MIPAKQRFDFFFLQLENLLEAGNLQNDPATFLYNNGGRNTLFMLEALARLNEKIYKKKRFQKLKESIKVVEDMLGEIDYFDSFAKSFAEMPAVNENVLHYLDARKHEAVKKLNHLLLHDNWIGQKKNKIDKFRKKIKDFDWHSEREDLEEVKKIYLKTIEGIQENYLPIAQRGFKQVEEEVHEFRRDIRWLSIYPQAMRGAIQLTPMQHEADPAFEKYLVPEIVGSPFNVFPAVTDQQWVLTLNRNHFYALSWMIDKFGELKDEGLKIFSLAHAIRDIHLKEEFEALSEAESILNNPINKREYILGRATELAKEYLEEGSLLALVKGIEHAEPNSQTTTLSPTSS